MGGGGSEASAAARKSVGGVLCTLLRCKSKRQGALVTSGSTIKSAWPCQDIRENGAGLGAASNSKRYDLLETQR